MKVIVLFFMIYLFMYVAVLGLRCGTRDLRPSLLPVEPLVTAGRFFVVACGI